MDRVEMKESPDMGLLVRLLRQPVRQAILRALAERGVLSFTEIRRAMSLTDGNLSTHARRLLEAELITSTKTFHGQLPRTEYSLTPAGRLAVQRLLSEVGPRLAAAPPPPSLATGDSSIAH